MALSGPECWRCQRSGFTRDSASVRPSRLIGAVAGAGAALTTKTDTPAASGAGGISRLRGLSFWRYAHGWDRTMTRTMNAVIPGV